MTGARSGTRVPRPPGTISTSMSPGAVANVCVGRMDSPKFDPCGFMLAARALVETGRRSTDTRERLRLYCIESRFSASRGPKTSSAWKAGKRTSPMLMGGGRGVAVGFSGAGLPGAGLHG